MTETRAQALLKESTVREVEDVLATKIEGKIAKMNEKIDSRITEILEAIRLIASNGGGIDRTQSSGMQNAMANPNQGHDDGRNREGNPNLGYSGLPRLSRIDFPRFSGDRVKDWLFKIEQFFLVDRTPEELKVELASIHFDDQAATWHQSLMQSDLGRRLGSEWTSYRNILLERFGEILDDPIAELQNLQETDGILDYHNKFEQIRTRLQLPEEYLVSAYLTGLSTDTQMNVRMFQPKSIRQCLMIGKLYESTLPKKVFSSGFRADLRESLHSRSVIDTSRLQPMIAESHDSLEEAEDSIGTRPTTPEPVVLYEANWERETPELMCVEVRGFEEQNSTLGTKSVEQGCVNTIVFPEDLQVITNPLEISAFEIKTGRIGNMVDALSISVEARAYKVFDELPRREIGIFECSKVDSLIVKGDSYGSIVFLGSFVFDPGKSNQFKRDWPSDCGRNSMEFLVNLSAQEVFVETPQRKIHLFRIIAVTD